MKNKSEIKVQVVQLSGKDAERLRRFADRFDKVRRPF